MNSEEIKLKESDTIRSNRPMLKSEDKPFSKTELSTVVEEDIINPQKPPIIHTREYSYLSESVINYFCIGLCLSIYGSNTLEWINIKDTRYKQFFLGYFLLSGIVLYFIGIFNW